MNSLESTRLLIKAIDFAAQKHKSQKRKNKNKDPYVNHVIGTCNFASQAGVEDTNILIACVLHDTIEDTQTTYEELLSLFGKDAANYVVEVTDDKKLTKSSRKSHQVQHSIEMSDQAKIIKLADKLYNISDLNEVDWDDQYIIGTVVWMKKIVNNMLNNFSDIKLIQSFLIMKKQFDNVAESVLLTKGINYNEIENEDAILDNYIHVLC